MFLITIHIHLFFLYFRKIANELKVLESLKTRKADIAQRTDKMSKSANEVASWVKQAEDLSENQESETMAQVFFFIKI